MKRISVLEAYRLDRYENLFNLARYYPYTLVLEAYRLDRYENLASNLVSKLWEGFRSLSFG